MTKDREGSDEAALLAAGRLFRRQGYAATTVRQIAAEAGMLPGSLHYRFASKEDLLVALMERGVSLAMRAVQRAILAVDDPVERLRAGLTAHLELLCDEDASLFVLLFDWRALPSAARAGMEQQRARYEAFWDELLLQAAATGRARDGLDLELLRQFGFGAVNWVVTWLQPGSGRTPKQIADAFFDYLARGVLRPEPTGATP